MSMPTYLAGSRHNCLFCRLIRLMTKGVIENANKLICKYIQKKANFDDFSDKRILEIQKKINRRPREKLNSDTPPKCFFDNIS